MKESTMKFNADDARLTAYALDELEGDESREVEALLESSEEARAEIAAIRAMARELEHDFGLMPARNEGQLTAVQRGAIVRHAAAQTAEPASRTWRRRTWQVAVVAASFLFMGYVLFDRLQLGDAFERSDSAPFVYSLFGDSGPSAGVHAEAAPQQLSPSESGLLEDLGYTGGSGLGVRG